MVKKNFGQKKFLLIKFEDLIIDKENTLKEILIFLNSLTKSKFEINEAKIKNVISSTNFEKMKNLEKKTILLRLPLTRMANLFPFFILVIKINLKNF